MPINYSLSPIPFWQFTDNAGIFAAGGYLSTFEALNHTQQKSIYSDPAGTIPYPNPVLLDSAGRIGPIYFADDEPYYITVTDASSLLIFEVDNYSPPSTGGSPITEAIDFQNYIINSQFREFLSPLPAPLPSSIEVDIAPPIWKFYKDGAGSNDILSFVRPILGTSPPDLTPTYVLQYSELATPTGETRKDILYVIEDVNSFQNQQTSFSFYARSDVSLIVEYGYIQFFGATGSATNEVLVDSVTVTSTWTRFNFDGAIIDTVFGKNIGGSQDTFSLFIRLPQNTPIQLFNLSDVQFQLTEAATPFIYESSTQTNLILEETDQVKVSTLDTTAGFLGQKLVAGNDISITTLNPTLNESLSIAYTGRDPINLNYTFIPILTGISAPFAAQASYNIYTSGVPVRAATSFIFQQTYNVIDNCNLRIRHRANYLRLSSIGSNDKVYMGLYLSTGTNPLTGVVVNFTVTRDNTLPESYEHNSFILGLTAGTLLTFEVRGRPLPGAGAGTFNIGNQAGGGEANFTLDTFFEFTEYLP
jgi:hypothetical protein